MLTGKGSISRMTDESFFGAKKEAKKHPPPPRPPPIWGGCNRSSCRSYIKVSSDHQRSGLIFYGWRDSATLIIYTIELTPRGMPRGRGRVATLERGGGCER